MTKPAVENVVRWMLAAWTLGASSFASPTVVHGHWGGNRPHQHDRAITFRVISHSFAPEALQDGHEGGTYLSAADVHQHGRLLLLGAVKYLPMPSEPSGPHDKSPCGWETIIAVSAAQGVRTWSKGLAVDHSGLASLADLSVGCICQSKQHEILVRRCPVFSSV